MPSLNTPPVKRSPSKRSTDEEESSWVSQLFGWVFILASLGVLYYMIGQGKPEGHMVCDRSVPASLTSFGSCRIE